MENSRSFFMRMPLPVSVWGQHVQRSFTSGVVKQGSVSSPLLFLLVIDSLLEELEAAGLGASIHNDYLGSLAHADDYFKKCARDSKP